LDANWLIVGLGNPGATYEKTRHNLGFMLVDLLAREFQTQVKRHECRSLIGRAEIENRKLELAKPQTFMNLSGEAVSCLLRKPERDVTRLVVISDDLALPFGRIRIRQAVRTAGTTDFGRSSIVSERMSSFVCGSGSCRSIR
jgi:peptidyl-tRNA hydrolase, PTH1 family